MAIIKNALTYGFGFNVTAAGPVDSRMRVNYLTDLTTVWGTSTDGVFTPNPDAPVYAGMQVIVNEQNKAYILKQQVAEGYTLNDNTQVVKNGLVYNKADDAPIAANPTDINNWVEVGKETDLTPIITKLDIDDDSGLTFDDHGSLAVKLVPDTDNYVNGIESTANGLKVATYNLRARSTSDDNYAAQYDFYVDNTVVSTINIPKDQFLKEATFVASATDEDQAIDSTVVLGDPYLKFVWQVDTDPEVSGLPTTYVAVKSLVDTYTAGDYITITDNKIAVDTATLIPAIKTEIGLNGITANISALQTTVGDSTSGLVADVAKNAADITANTTSIESNTKNITSLASKITEIQAEGIINGVDTEASHGVSLVLDETVENDRKVAKVNVDLEALRADLSVNADAVLTTADIKDNETATDPTYASGSSVQTILADLSKRITNIDTTISGSIGVAKVLSGNGITVTGDTTPTVSVKVATGSALKATTDGLDIYWTEI